MRLLAIGIVTFLLLGALFVFGRQGFDADDEGLERRETTVFEDTRRLSSQFVDADGDEVFAIPVYREEALILSGLPSYATQTFMLPIDAKAIAGEYRLAVTTRVAEGVEGVLRVSINGEKRGELLLDEGRNRESMQVQLASTDLVGEDLQIGLSLQGRGPIAECTPDDAIAAVVEVEPETGLALALGSADASLRDRIAIHGGRVDGAWPADGIDLRSLVNLARLVDKGYDFTLDNTGLSSGDLSEIAREAPLAPSETTAQWPVSLTGDVSNAGVRRFDRYSSWRFDYGVATTSRGTLPSTLELTMRYGPSSEERRHDLAVMVNDRLLLTRNLPGADENFIASVPIPAEIQGPENRVEIAISSAEEEVRCGTVTPSFAELLPETRLAGPGLNLERSLPGIAAQLAGSERVALWGQSMSPGEAERSVRLLASLNPRRIHFVTGEGDMAIRVMVGDLAAQFPRGRPAGNRWLVYRQQGEAGGIVARPATSANAREAGRVALLIEGVGPMASAQQGGASAANP
ncbi:hypothetical protein PF049_00695 [Erythrobacteraceae bacterium WH01K]|nr:hypothetical protein PF049_00695 [Erythrobacteraceae bacterium WH01K]